MTVKQIVDPVGLLYSVGEDIDEACKRRETREGVSPAVDDRHSKWWWVINLSRQVSRFMFSTTGDYDRACLVEMAALAAMGAAAYDRMECKQHDFPKEPEFDPAVAGSRAKKPGNT